MVASTGLVAKTIAFKISDGATPTPAFTAVANVENIEINGREVDEIEFTHLLTEIFKEYKPGFVDPGTITLTIAWNPADATHDEDTGIEYLLTSGLSRDWKLDFTGLGIAKVLSGNGFVRSNNGSIPVGDKITSEVMFRINGATTWGAT